MVPIRIKRGNIIDPPDSNRNNKEILQTNLTNDFVKLEGIDKLHERHFANTDSKK